MRVEIVAALALLASCAPPTQETTPSPPTPAVTDAPAGAYALDPAHATLSLRVDHIGFSMYTAQFTQFGAALLFDPVDVGRMSVDATIAVRSLELPNPPLGFRDSLLGPDWLDAGQFPEIAFRSTAIELTGANTARVVGDLTLHGVTRPVTLEATFNGGYAGHTLEPNARIGFSALGTFKRSDFGIALGVPPPGSTMGVGDDVDVIIEAEFTGPPWSPPATP